ncbi:hypothetical protein NDU88_006417 [Pleurodeles waltl]|uniref:Uncharacterized protein n=1 Tax=Pleurodeles waltl TaxID=8319 RepID=A0AAV7WAJ1_PLEWA|nr:hypothetical protein NDU88_006417 [Pleurodeles waltl]
MSESSEAESQSPRSSRCSVAVRTSARAPAMCCVLGALGDRDRKREIGALMEPCDQLSGSLPAHPIPRSWKNPEYEDTEERTDKRTPTPKTKTPLFGGAEHRRSRS